MDTELRPSSFRSFRRKWLRCADGRESAPDAEAMTDTEGSSGVPSLVGWEEAHKIASVLLEAATNPVCYTTEHAHAVADLSRSVGMEFGLGEGALEALELGALLHDLGKLGVPEASCKNPVLSRVGRWRSSRATRT